VLTELHLSLPRPVVALVTSDEELGSPSSRELIETQARSAAYALVMEPPLPDGSLKTARKGVGGYTLHVRGRSADAGVEPEKGASAIVELAHQVLVIQSIADISRGTSVNIGLIEGGSSANSVAATAWAKIDVRVATLGEAERVDSALRRLAPVVPGTSLF